MLVLGGLWYLYFPAAPPRPLSLSGTNCTTRTLKTQILQNADMLSTDADQKPLIIDSQYLVIMYLPRIGPLGGLALADSRLEKPGIYSVRKRRRPP